MIRAESIMWLWMAEGLIPIRGGERMEDTAKDILNKLIRRSLIQVADTFWGEVTKCRIHDLLRDLVLQKALQVYFFDIYDSRNHSISPLCFRHVIHSQAKRYFLLHISNLNIRSITFFDREISRPEVPLDQIKLHKIFQHLYVLHLEDNFEIMLHDSIGSLYHLKYLCLRTSYVPSSIGNLKNLQTLQIVGAGSCILPPEIANLTNLRHLVVAMYVPLKHINKLRSLQVLRDIKCDQWKDVDPVDLVNLQELTMGRIDRCYSLNNISSLRNLSTLRLECKVGDSFPALEFLSSLQNLQKLWLEGRIEKLPPFPNSIIMMVLDSPLMEDPMPILGMLPNLRDLALATYKGKEITCSDNNFCQLEFLRLQNIDYLYRWNLGTSAMPQLKRLTINKCPNLKEIPPRMKGVAILF